tara:strand:+ start:68 stop:397 length:330 start_codon:yes stop_codon:yes gene_type:complete
MSLLPSTIASNNHKLYFSKSELKKILNCYSLGVSKGSWKDYAINFYSNEAIFSIYKHSWALPDCILVKVFEKKRRKIFFKLSSNNKSKKYENLDILIKSLRREQFKIIN